MLVRFLDQKVDFPRIEFQPFTDHNQRYNRTFFANPDLEAVRNINDDVKCPFRKIDK